MKKAAYAFLAVFVFLVVGTAFPQGIQSSIVNLPLNGKWRQASEIERDTSAPGVQVFYDEATGTLLQIRNDYQLRAVGDISQQFNTAGKSLSGPDGARIFLGTMFPLPNKYTREVSSTIHEGRAPKLWEVKDPGNADWFYVSQLFGGYHVTGGGKSSEIHEEYLPMKVNLAEHQSVPSGDVLLFEAETDKTPVDAAIKRFKMPPSLKEQRLRYGWIQFSPGGITSSESIISVAFATPVNSGFDSKAVLDQLVQNYKKPQAKN